MSLNYYELMETPTASLEITSNNIYDVTEKAQVVVNVPNPSTGKLTITDTAEKDVTNYAQAQVVDANLVAGNIKKDTAILGITGTLAEATPIDINSDAGMTEVLTAANVGKVYKFIGTTGTYKNGDLYSPTVPHTSIYRFYKADGTTEIAQDDWSVAGLADAYYYTKNGGAQQRVGGRIFHIDTTKAEGSVDKFYVYDTEKGIQENLMWSDDTSTDMGCTTNTIGSGKTNSAIMLAAKGDLSGSIWNFINNTMNADSVGGCNDWYIGSTLENDQLKNANLVDWFSNKYIWSSVEDLYSPTSSSLYWDYGNGYWYSLGKRNARCCFAVRSF